MILNIKSSIVLFWVAKFIPVATYEHGKNGNSLVETPPLSSTSSSERNLRGRSKDQLVYEYSNDDPFNELGADDLAIFDDFDHTPLFLDNVSNDMMPEESHPDMSDSSSNDSSGGFNISLMHMGSDATYNEIFQEAARRWENIVVGDLPDVKKSSSSSHCWFGSTFDREINVDIDDVLIGYEIEEIDGEGGVLGYAGPIFRRRGDNSRNSMTAISGIMKFDQADFENMSTDDIQLVIIHEMGHVLGIGTFWDEKCGTKCSSGDNSYTCDRAKTEYNALGYSDDLKLESKVCGHWSENNFGYTRDEIMTPFFDEGMYQPISRITTAALFDLGYDVDFSTSDPWNNSRDRFLVTHGNESKVLVPSQSFVIDESVIIKPVMIDF